MLPAAQIVKKLFLVGFVALIEPGKTVQLIFGFAFCLVYLLFSSVIVPFVADDDDFFCTLCNFVLTAILFLCVVLKQATLAEEMEPYMTTKMLALYWFDSGVVSAILIAVIIIAALVAIAFAVQQLMRATRNVGIDDEQPLPSL